MAIGCWLLVSGCGRYRDFTLPEQPGGPSVAWQWQARTEPVLTRGAPGDWDAVDVLNPSVIRQGDAYYNFFSGFDGKTWHTGLAVSADGVAWQQGRQDSVAGARPPGKAARSRPMARRSSMRAAFSITTRPAKCRSKSASRDPAMAINGSSNGPPVLDRRSVGKLG